MSTRASIIIKASREDGRKEIHLYHHHDGYPKGGVGEDLKEYLEQRKNHYYWDAWRIATELIKRREYDKERDGEYELSWTWHGDIEYLYVIDCESRTLQCYKRDFGTDELNDILNAENLVTIP